MSARVGGHASRLATLSPQTVDSGLRHDGACKRAAADLWWVRLWGKSWTSDLASPRAASDIIFS